MSLRIGIILCKNIEEEVLNKIRKKYNIGLIRFDNYYIQRQLDVDEQFFQFSKYGDDSDYGIGAYDIYTKDLAPIYDNNELSEERKKFFIEDIKRIRKRYEETAEMLINMIKEIISIEGTGRVGIFHFWGYTTSDEVKFRRLKKETCSVNDLDIEYIMKIKENVIVYFQ